MEFNAIKNKSSYCRKHVIHRAGSCFCKACCLNIFVCYSSVQQRKCVTVSDKYPKVITLTQLLNRMNRKLRRRRTCATSISTQSLIMSHEKVVIPLWEHCSSTRHEMFLLMQQFICLMKHQVFRKRKSSQPFIETMFRKKQKRRTKCLWKITT